MQIGRIEHSCRRTHKRKCSLWDNTDIRDEKKKCVTKVCLRPVECDLCVIGILYADSTMSQCAVRGNKSST